MPNKTNIITQELALLRACKTDEERDLLKKQLIEKHKNESQEAKMNNLESLKQEVGKAKTSLELLKTDNMVSLSYLSEKYLGKSRSYLSQRINGNIVNGKVVTLTEEDKQKLKEGLQDISKKLYELSLSFSNV